MKSTLMIAVALVSQAAACSEPAGEQPLYTTKTGSIAVDQFISWVQHGNEPDIARTAEFQTISGLYPQFKTGAEYLAWVEGCRISRVAQTGMDAAGNVVSLDPSLRTGPAAVKDMGPVYWVNWDCPKGRYRQALNAAYEWPKVMVSEMMVRERELPAMRPPEKASQ